MTPDDDTDPDATQIVQDMALACGAQVETMSAEAHDRTFAWVSHLPHVAAFALADAIARDDAEYFAFGGGGLHDFLRIAASDPVMWRDIFHTNRGPLQEAIAGLRAAIERLEDALDDPDQMTALLEAVQQQVRRAREQG